ncbi:unnamed protein product, partial [Rotaria sordida]
MSSAFGKCPLYLKVLLVKNFKRHCEHCHDSVNTKEKYGKLLLKMEQTINSQHQHTPTSSKSTSSNESSTMISNKTSATISNETNIESSAVYGYVSSPDFTLIPDDNKSLDNVQFQHFVEIKNHICGDIKYILKQTEFASKLVELAFDETVSVKNFLVETTSTFNKLKESINDLLILCNKTLENIPSTPTTVDKIQSTEKPISHDPSIIKVFDENELHYLVNQGPYQPLLSQYPWYKEFPLIEYSPITDSIYCFCCRLFGRGPGGAQPENTWVSTGTKMWNKVKGSQGTGKKGKIYIHIASETHKYSLKRYMTFRERKNNVDYMLDKDLQQQEQQKIEQKKTNEQIIKIPIDCSRFLARQRLGSCGHTDEDSNFYQLVNLLSRYNPTLDDWINNNNTRPFKITYMSKDSQNEFIQLLGECVQEKNLREIRQAAYYSIMADSSIDSDRKDMLSVYIRFVNEQGEPEERFVSIKEVHSKT